MTCCSVGTRWMHSSVEPLPAGLSPQCSCANLPAPAPESTHACLCPKCIRVFTQQPPCWALCGAALPQGCSCHLRKLTCRFCPKGSTLCRTVRGSALSLCCLHLPACFVQLQQLSQQLLPFCYRTQEGLTVKDTSLAQDPLILSPT